MIIIKSFDEIYKNIVSNFYKRTKIDVEPRSIIDMIFKSVADSLKTIYKVIEDNKKPYLFTKQTGEELDDTGYFLNCPRLDDESDANYLYRLSNWTQRNASCNQTAIEDKCKELLYSSSASYVPYTHGVGTATIYLIPLEYSTEAIDAAVNEAEEKISKITAPTSIIYYKVMEPIPIKLTVYLDVDSSFDIVTIKNTIKTNIKNYINSIPPGSNMMLGTINKIGLSVNGVEYFNVVQLFNNNEEITDFEILQTIEAKFLLDEIIWWEVEN